MPKEPLARRFWRFVKKGEGPDSCWLWCGEMSWTGYGRFRPDTSSGRRIQAHRLSWILHKGPIPHGLFVLHRCDVRLCVRPSHLWLGTLKENTQDMLIKGRGGKHRGPGELNGNAKLTEAAVRQIWKRLQAGEGPTDIGRSFGVTHSLICRIRKGQTWTHVTDQLH